MYIYISPKLSSAKFVFYIENIYYSSFVKDIHVYEGKILELLENKNPLQLIEKITNNIIFK